MASGRGLRAVRRQCVPPLFGAMRLTRLDRGAGQEAPVVAPGKSGVPAPLCAGAETSGNEAKHLAPAH